MQKNNKIRAFFFSPILIYIIRCIIGFSIGYYLLKTFPRFDFFWALLSILLVISPEGKDSKRLSMERVKANFIGALSGIIVFSLPIELYFKILIGIAAAALICKLFNLLNVSRSAIVAIIIVLMERPDESFMAPVERFVSVFIGCIIGLLVTISTAFMIKFVHRKILDLEYHTTNKN